MSAYFMRRFSQIPTTSNLALQANGPETRSRGRSADRPVAELGSVRPQGAHRMSYDLLIGASPKVKGYPAMAGVIEFEEIAPLKRISERHRSWLFDRLLNYFEDQSFTPSELREAVSILDNTILAEQGEAERRILYKVSAIFSMALRKNLPVHGVSD